MYPDNKEVTIYGEKVSYPGVGADGKYTAGDFNDPLVPPSRLDPETINLVIDNLNALIKSMGLEPNNTGGEQLAALFSVAAEAHKGIKRDVHGRAKVAAPVASDDIARKQEVDAEASTRASSDNALGVRITTEASTRASGDNALGGRISGNDNDIANINSKITNLQQYRSYETNTGKTWVTGQVIYRNAVATQNTFIMLNIGSRRNIVAMSFTEGRNSQIYAGNYWENGGAVGKYDPSNGNVYLITNGYSPPFTMCVEYCK